ncbi:hypothetical protein BKG92_07670 [Rodentibacter ratti]|uniref:Conjugal transfer protein TraX n=1 Tax=Rodentibacter ratti TaxID=1906745 RepID=A0A1V3KWF7_9PAST|nr:TraX family protein [Rodentibacter ratti]OOF81989.1 hypothetical protein BKG92_07670 [Rodentibacter ratti]
MPYLTSSQTELLKWLALITMIIDHIGVAFSNTDPELSWCRVIGRFSYVSFGFIIALNLSRDKVNFRSYFIWMIVTAFLSEISFKFFDPSYKSLNVLFQFLAVIGVMWVYKNRQHLDKWMICLYVGFFVILSGFSDYGLSGLVYCIGCYLFLQTKDTQSRLIAMLTCVLLALLVNHKFIDNAGTIVKTISVIGVVVGTMIFILHPKGLRRRNVSISRMPKCFFYLFYPVHLTIIVGIKSIFIG